MRTEKRRKQPLHFAKGVLTDQHSFGFQRKALLLPFGSVLNFRKMRLPPHKRTEDPMMHKKQFTPQCGKRFLLFEKMAFSFFSELSPN
jgi:hypothetical protein